MYLLHLCLTFYNKLGNIGGLHFSVRGGAVAARRAHNPKVAGSSPAPATHKDHVKTWSLFFNHLLPLSALSSIQTCMFTHAFIHGHICKWFTENAIVNCP